jgi:hypothetical protein
MSQQTVGIIIDKLLSDEDLRIRFVVDRMETLAELYLRGVELRPDEIDLFCGTDARLWFWCAGSAANCSTEDDHHVSTNRWGTYDES